MPKKSAKVSDRTPQIQFKFNIDYKGKHYHFPVLEIRTKFPLTFMVGYDGGWTYFHWDGEKWIHEIKDQELANLVIEMLILGYESKQMI